MTPDQEIIIYDALRALTNCSQTLSLLVSNHGTYGDKNAYREGVYAAAIKLQIAMGDEALARGKARYEAIEAQAAAFFASARPGREKPTTPTGQEKDVLTAIQHSELTGSGDQSPVRTGPAVMAYTETMSPAGRDKP